MFRLSLLVLGLLTAAAFSQQPTRDQKVRDDKKKVEAEGFWIYNDLAKGFTEAKKTGKPLLAVLRCIPCMECVKLDDDLINQDPSIRPLLDKFVCVRLVSTNGLDLSLFQFDTDQSFAVFLLNADGTVYGRFGTRSHRTNWAGDVSLAGLAKALQGALDLHVDSPKHKPALTGKRGPAPDFAVPEKYPALRDKYGPALNYSGNVGQSCIHCHQIGDAQRQIYHSRKEPLPETVLFPHPHPKSIGLLLDPREKATVIRVEPRSIAEAAGFAAGDVILQLEGQPLLSIADVQWVLHSTSPDGAKLTADVLRAGKSQRLDLTLPNGWRRVDDISWRSTSWGLRRMATGGLLLESLSEEARAKLGVTDGSMALRVKHVGQYGPHAAAKQAGFRVDDVVVSFDGRSNLKRETDLLAHGVTARKPGDQVAVTILREGKQLTLMLPMQE